MIKNIIPLLVSILLIFSNVAIAQTESPYMDFNPVSVKENAKFTKNFTPNSYDSKVLYNCMTAVLDAARAQYRFVPELKHDLHIDSTAQFQADFMAEKDERTEDNYAPYKTLPYRLRKYGLSGNGMELITKVKAYLGEQEYTYYDLCLAAVQSLLKNNKLAEVLLDKQYSYVGIGFNTDAQMKNMYISVILGNDRTFNPYKPAPGAKDLPYSKGMAGLKAYDDKVCKKCATEPGLEVLSEYVSLNKNGEVYIVCDDYKQLKKLIGKEGDAIAIDFVQRSQYECDGFIVDYDHPSRGFVTKPITFETIFSKNENANLKNGKLISKIADLPEQINLNSDLDLHVLVLKEGNRVCRTVIAKNIEAKNAAYDEKINFIKDDKGIKSAGEWVIAPEESTFSVKFPYELKKTDYTTAAFDSALKNNDVPAYKVNKIEIIAHNSPNYYKDAAYQKIQTKRAEFLKKDMLAKSPGADISITYDYCWDWFKEAIVNSSDFYDLSFLTLDEAASQLRYDSWALKSLDSEYLAPCRYYEIKYYVTYLASTKEEEQAFAVWKFNQAIAKKNRGLAMSIEDYMIDQIEKGNFHVSSLKELQIPNNKDYQTLLNNRLYLQYKLAKKLTEPVVTEMKSIYNLNTENRALLYNTTVGDVMLGKITSTADVARTQANIDRLYAIPDIPKDRVNSLNMEFQLKVVNYLDTAPVNMENTTLLATTFAKIKEIRNPKLDSWQNAYKLASYFIKKHDYLYALSLMDPFLDDPTISEDFIMSYVSIAAHREQTYMSSLFTEAVKIAYEKNPTRLCAIFDKVPYCVMENADVKEILCKNCDR
ncbi:MAG: hypothetical protein K5636_04785 [Bacteroidales bacterium]|nr:hypothetical protein [Bacteroidales bacterium]